MTQVPPPESIFEHREGVWIKPSWLRFSGLTLQTRMVVLKLGSDLLLYSPSPAKPDDETLDELRRLGTPRWLLAPNEIHNVGLAGFQAAFPDAHTTGCVGHPARVKTARFDLLLDEHTPDDAPPWARDGRLRFHVIGGNAVLHEVALLHVPSRTLVVTDAVEYFVPGDPTVVMQPRPIQWMLRWSGITLGAPCMSPEHNLLCTDPDALEASLEVLANWDFDSLVMSHGRIVSGDAAREALVGAFRANIDRVRRRSTLMRKAFVLAARFA